MGFHVMVLFVLVFMMRLPMVAMHQPFCGPFAGLLFIAEKPEM